MEDNKKTPTSVKIVSAIISFFLEALFIMLLWNWLTPYLLPTLPAIGYWQAIGLDILCNLLFNKKHEKL